VTDFVQYLNSQHFVRQGLVAAFDALYTSDTVDGIIARLQSDFLPAIQQDVPDVTLDAVMDTLLKNGDIDAASWLQVAVAHREQELRDDQADVSRAYNDVLRRSHAIFGPNARWILHYEAITGQLRKMRQYLDVQDIPAW